MTRTKCQEKNRKRDERRRRQRLCDTGTADPIQDKAELWRRRMERNPPLLKGMFTEWKPVCDERGDMCIVGRLQGEGVFKATSPVLFMTNTLCETLSGSFYALRDPHPEYLAYRIQIGLGDVTTKAFAFYPS